MMLPESSILIIPIASAVARRVAPHFSIFHLTAISSMCFETAFVVLFGVCIGQTVRSQIQKKRKPRPNSRGFFRALRDQIPYVRKAPGPTFVTPY
ncbi:unnamed protein product [Rodentolepis nana]|uniref:Secreted protein n=1 Tax=Rodentolepis nana TaxID=102285 RepID=A0A0R3TRK0_RODNA|nr:unnamed protein product [Rodentolepis nana]